MGLPAALKAHAAKDFTTAAVHYQRALDQKDFKPVLFQNYGALLRQLNKSDQAKSVYEQGISLYPNEVPILRNYANLIRESSPSKALSIHLSLLRDHFKSLDSDVEVPELLPIIQILKQLKCNHWALDVCKFSLCTNKLTAQVAIEILYIMSDLDESSLDSKNLSQLENVFYNILATCEESFQAEFLYSLSWLYFEARDFAKAVDLLARARLSVQQSVSADNSSRSKAIKMNDITCWNASTILLKAQDFALGWQLFDSGLRAPAPGPQAWQRALPKPFTHSEIEIWRGENLAGKNLLLLEEQAVGDVMQFMTLLPELIAEAAHVSVLVNNRLLPIYRRFYGSKKYKSNVTIVSFDDIKQGRVSSDLFHYQSPLGSVCQYRFSHPSRYGLNSPSISASKKSSIALRNKYLSNSPHKKKIIGISWRGGGTHTRIKQKSISVAQFQHILQDFDDVLFVSLQYGDVESALNHWSKSHINVLHDETINPLKSMDSWLSQVAACDAVISVANTTIHGSGGLNIPTLCLLSRFSDWRWFDDPSVDMSYWYPSVGIARESVDTGWDNAIQQARSWIKSGCPINWSTPYNV